MADAAHRARALDGVDSLVSFAIEAIVLLVH
jgi:hypothetical protein